MGVCFAVESASLCWIPLATRPASLPLSVPVSHPSPRISLAFTVGLCFAFVSNMSLRDYKLQEGRIPDWWTSCSSLLLAQSHLPRLSIDKPYSGREMVALVTRWEWRVILHAGTADLVSLSIQNLHGFAVQLWPTFKSMEKADPMEFSDERVTKKGWSGITVKDISCIHF